MEIKRNFITGKNRPGIRIHVDWITIHETGNTNAGADAKAHRNYAQNNNRGVSYHWTVDDKVIIQVLPDIEMAWHAGSKEGNKTSVSIEICENKDANQKKTYQNAAYLAAYLLHKHKLPLQRMVPHKHWSGKNCPRNLLLQWETFQKDVSSQLLKLHSEKTHILGKSEVNAAQMRAYLKQKNPEAPDFVAEYFRMEEIEGVRADVAFAQSLLETNYWRFGGIVERDQNNFAGLGATGPGQPGLSFPTPWDGIRAQGRHLRLYATYAPELNDRKVDPRGLPDRLLGWAPFVEELSGTWAADPEYGNKIISLIHKMKQVPTENTPPPHWAAPELQKLKERRIILEDHHPEDQVTYGELATMLNRVLDKIYQMKKN
jgi:flagellum-specific peptidoglycan hydrolase FlgJ